MGDIELGNLDRQTESRHIGEKPPQPGGRKRWSANARKMGLNADRVDRCPGSPHSLEQIEKRRAARFLLRGVELDIVLIDDKARRRIGFACDTVDQIEIIRSDCFEKHSRTKTVLATLFGLDRLLC